MVPAFSAWVGMPLKETIATSLACVGIFAIPGTLTHWYLGHIDWTFAVALAVGVIPGARIGAHFTINADRPVAALQRRRRARDHRGDLRRRRARSRWIKLTRPHEHRVEHAGREPAGERVLLARVERADDGDAAARRLRARARTAAAAPAARRPGARPRAASPRSPRSRTRRARRSPAPACSSCSSRTRYGMHASRSCGRRLVRRRRAADGRGDVGVVQLAGRRRRGPTRPGSRSRCGAATRRGSRPTGRR